MTDIPARLTEIHSALVEKIGGQPRMEPSLTIYQSGKYRIGLYPRDSYDCIHVAEAASLDGALDAAMGFIEKMPDPEAAAKMQWHKKLGAVIDEGHSLALPDDVMTPLRGASQAMAKNLLPAPEAVE